MQETNQTPNYVTPLRRSLGLSRRLKGSASSNPSPTVLTPQSFLSPQITSLHYNNENMNSTPVSNYSNTSLKTSLSVSPLKQELSNTGKRVCGLSLAKSRIKEKPLKKKKLNFLEHKSVNPEEIDCKENQNSVEQICDSPSFIKVERNISVPDLTTIITFDPQENDENFLNELKEIELLKQKDIRKRLDIGMKVKEGRIKQIESFHPTQSFYTEKNIAEPPPPEFGFHSAKVEIQVQQKEYQNSISPIKQSHEEHVMELKKLIQEWKRGLRDSMEYLSCLSYPPIEVNDIIKHYEIHEKWLVE